MMSIRRKQEIGPRDSGWIGGQDLPDLFRDTGQGEDLGEYFPDNGRIIDDQNLELGNKGRPR
jgi:hypothetical protein